MYRLFLKQMKKKSWSLYLSFLYLKAPQNSLQLPYLLFPITFTL